MKITISLNGENTAIDSGCLLDKLLHDRDIPRPVAIAINGEFVPQSQYDETEIKSGDSVEIVAPMQGG